MVELRFRFDAALRELVQPGPRRMTVRRPYLLMPWPELWVRLADEGCRHAGSTTRCNQLGSRPQEVEVSASVLYMSMSLDGYIAGPNDDPANPGGDGFDRLHEWITTPDGEYGRPSGPAGELFDEWNATGAVLAGRRTVEQVDHWGGDHHGVPIFVPSHRPPGPSVANYPLVTYVTDGIASAMAQAKAAAGDRNVTVQGAYTAQRALEAGVLDELQIHQVPVLFGGGRQLFEVLPSRVELEIVRVIDTPEATHLRYRVRR
jgi:dihydrofolate reductase